MVISASSGFSVNCLIWISSLKSDEKGTTYRVHDDLQPFLLSIGLPFEIVEAESANQLFEALDAIAHRAKTGLKPIIHFDTHGSKQNGLYIVASDEYISWSQLIDKLRSINVATGNNLCVVSAACWSFHTIKEVSIESPAPFFALIAPENEVTLGFVEKRTCPFYESVFTTMDVNSAHEQHLRPSFRIFLSEKMFLVSLTKYVGKHCLGKGRRQRVEDVLTTVVAGGLPNTIQNRRIARGIAKQFIEPTQELIEKYAQRFLLGKKIDVNIQQIVQLAQNASNKTQKRKARRK